MSVNESTKMSTRQQDILNLIREKPGITRAEIASRLNIKSGQVELAISGFDARGYYLAEGDRGSLTLIIG